MKLFILLIVAIALVQAKHIKTIKRAHLESEVQVDPEVQELAEPLKLTGRQKFPDLHIDPVVQVDPKVEEDIENWYIPLPGGAMSLDISEFVIKRSTEVLRKAARTDRRAASVLASDRNLIYVSKQVVAGTNHGLIYRLTGENRPAVFAALIIFQDFYRSCSVSSFAQGSSLARVASEAGITIK